MMIRRFPRRLLAVVALLLSMMMLAAAPAALASASQEDESAIDNLYIRRIDGTDPQKVQVSFIWNGSRGDLEKLTIRENGKKVETTKPQPLNAAGVPIAVVLVLDQSGSMTESGALDETKRAMQRMLDDLGPDDSVSIVGFSNEAKTYLEPTTDKAAARAALEEIGGEPGGKTAMWDAVTRSAALLKQTPDAQPNMLLVTDGTDDVSEAGYGVAVGRIVDAHSAVWAMGIDSEGELDRGNLDRLVGKAGGQLFDTDSAKKVGEAFDQVATSLQRQYVVEYASTAGRGANDVDVAVGGTTKSASYVTGATSEGASAQPTEVPKQWGPEILRSGLGKWLALGTAALAAALLAFAVVNLATKTPSELDTALSQYSHAGVFFENDDMDDAGSGQSALMQRAVQATEDFAERQGFLTKVEAKLEQADLPLRAPEAMFGYFAGMVLVVILAMLMAGIFMGLIITLVIGILPVAILNYLGARRRKAFQAQLPDMLQLLSGSLRAGYSLMQGVEVVSQEVTEPMGKELRRVMTEARLGRDLEQSLEGVAERMDSDDFEWAVMAIRIQREVGGNLAELLMTVSETMISRERLRRDVAGLTAEGKISAIVIGGLPVGLGLIMYAINPLYMEPLFTTMLGKGMLGVAILAALIGFAWMKKTITIKI